ncbi:Uroporphyrinogen-III C-methyltransferase; Uroporphyrinogen-III synthase [Candidatus Desulfarcum epimagneticum]|uniref:uroporphyrinogen-III C-methyltransferase n=1 Tax=uncultured Desulfobacteraceae bacterium TaxID=218296 RepID=A0A484HIS8_9BACT|nr:Uroporphyrinogen-III C-methyltransferase; Uroporphyrinogen-III synthase [uncultured Desulfobacteraceae bacterium]
MKKKTTEKKGKVFLVGAGPGDPGLITVKGLECVAKADVVIYDYLANPAFLRHAAKDAELIYVGKKGGDHTMSQEGINALIVQKAKTGARVTRLKGGDPFIFGRGGEEVETLAGAGVSFEVVPGVTSAIAAPAYAGIPLTHRGAASSVTFVTGHEDPLKEGSDIDWEVLAKNPGTLVFLMGMKNLADIASLLMKHGKSEDTPAAIVRRGTTGEQRTVSGTLETIFQRATDAGMKAPAVIVVGKVAGLRKSMKWFENRPLMGKTIVTTRARAQAGEFSRMLESLGARALEFPTIEIAPPEDPIPLSKAVDDIASYDWLVFTSVNGVQRFFEALFEKNKDARALAPVKTAVIGPATEQRLLDFGVRSDIVPETYRAESIVAAFEKTDIEGKRVLLPRAKDARPILPVELRKMGAHVDEVPAYRARPVSKGAGELVSLLEKKEIDMVVFTSSSTARNFAALLPPGRMDELMESVTVAVIGPITARTALDLGFQVDVSADEYTMEGLTRAILKWAEGAASPC